MRNIILYMKSPDQNFPAPENAIEVQGRSLGKDVFESIKGNRGPLDTYNDGDSEMLVENPDDLLRAMGQRWAESAQEFLRVQRLEDRS